MRLFSCTENLQVNLHVQPECVIHQDLLEGYVKFFAAISDCRSVSTSIPHHCAPPKCETFTPLHHYLTVSHIVSTKYGLISLRTNPVYQDTCSSYRCMSLIPRLARRKVTFFFTMFVTSLRSPQLTEHLHFLQISTLTRVFTHQTAQQLMCCL